MRAGGRCGAAGRSGPPVQAARGRPSAAVHRRGSVHGLSRWRHSVPDAGLPARSCSVPSRWRRTVTVSPAQVRRPGCFAICRAIGAQRHDVVRAHHPRLFVTQDLLEVDVAHRHPRRLRVARRVTEGRVVLRDEDVPQIGIRRLARRDARHAQLIDQAILQRPIHPLTAAPRLRRVRRDVLDAQPRQGPAHLGDARLVHRARSPWA